MTMSGKIALVTGGASGFGAGIVEAFVQAGAQVAILDINFEAALALARQFGDQTLAVAANVTELDDLQAAVSKVDEWAGNPNVVVNNAGIAQLPTPLEALEESDFDRIGSVNMKAIYLMSRVMVPRLKALGGGAILNIASTAGVSPRPNLTWYNASKGWVITATRSMAVELASDNIRVNALNPVAGDTPMLSTFLGDDTPERRQQFLDSIPLGRFSQPEDIGQAAAFLCSDQASMITGVAMEVDGGRCI